MNERWLSSKVQNFEIGMEEIRKAAYVMDEYLSSRFYTI